MVGDQIEVTLKEFDNLIKIVTRKVIQKFNYEKHFDQYEDFISEARIAAWMAIKTYNKDKNAKLDTYITRCIKNRLYSINRKRNRKKNPSILLSGDIAMLADNNNWEHPHFTIQTLLNEKEIKIVENVINGESLKQLGSRREVKKCLDQIRQKLTLEETNPV